MDATLNERLQAVREAAARDRHRSPEAARELLATRARQLARVSADDMEAGEALDLLVFQVGDEELALPISTIVAIARAGRIVPLPRAVAPVYGVTAWRGRPLTVLTLATRTADATPLARLVVLGTGSRASLAVLVDAVHDVTRVPLSGISPPGPGARRQYAHGMTSAGMLIVSGDVLLHPETLSP